MSKHLDLVRSQLEQMGIREEDLVEKFILGTGKGGQKINKTSSCVYLKHIPSGIEIKCQKERSQELNRCQARIELIKKLKERERKAQLLKTQIKEKLRRQKRKRSNASQEKVLEGKKRRSAKKKWRGRPPTD